MTYASRALAPLALLAVAATTARAQSLPPTGFEIGAPFPAIAFPALEDGQPYSLADFKGRKTILHIWASW